MTEVMIGAMHGGPRIWINSFWTQQDQPTTVYALMVSS